MTQLPGMALSILEYDVQPVRLTQSPTLSAEPPALPRRRAPAGAFGASASVVKILHLNDVTTNLLRTNIIKNFHIRN